MAKYGPFGPYDQMRGWEGRPPLASDGQKERGPAKPKERLAIPYGWLSLLWSYSYPYMAKRDGQKEAQPSALWPKRASDT
jgi:hypothetical protein